MSRPIKFRVWSRLYNKYINFDSYYEGHHLALRPDGKLYDADCSIEYAGTYSEAPVLEWDNQSEDCEAEEYTGLKDKNGKEIYEGDILQDSKGKCCRVNWNEKEAHFGLYTGKQFELTDFVWMRGEDVEVIGNIHETPELLGGEK